MRQVRGREIAMIFQEPMTSLNPVLTVGRQLTEGLEIHLKLSPAAARARAVELLGMVGIPDPAEAKGSAAEVGLAFRDAYRMLSQRIGIFAALPIRILDQLSLQRRLDEIGRMQGAKVAEPS